MHAYYYIQAIALIQVFFHLIGVGIMLSAGVLAVFQYILARPWLADRKTLRIVENTRVALGQKIVLGLEFFIISDAIATITDPSLDDLYRVAIVVGIRTALSFFISRELHILHRSGDPL